MFTIYSKTKRRDCEGNTRRDFLKVGAIGGSLLTLPNLLRAKAKAPTAVNNKSVIWIWLAGGPTHVETFDPKMTAPSEYRSITGEAKTPLPGVTMGGTFPKIASCGDKMALVRSFAHGNSSHGNATKWVMTGYDDRQGTRPSMGSIAARKYGTTHPLTGIPTYIRMNGIGGDGPGWLGTGYSPFDPNGQAVKNMGISVAEDRFATRRGLLNSLDNINRKVDSSGKMEGIDAFEQQAFDLIIGSSRDAFDINKEPKHIREAYGSGTHGRQLLMTRRLLERGVRFIQVWSGNGQPWDNHDGLEKNHRKLAGEWDQPLAAFLTDLRQRGLLESTLVLWGGEFGRTPVAEYPQLNGRDHNHYGFTCWLAGGGTRGGYAHGATDEFGFRSVDKPVHVHDLHATMLHLLGLDHERLTYRHAGRDFRLTDVSGNVVKELLA